MFCGFFLILSEGIIINLHKLFSIVHSLCNYNSVVQKLVGVCDEAQLARLVGHLQPCEPYLRRIQYGKHLIARVEKVLGKSLSAYTLRSDAGGDCNSAAAEEPPAESISATSPKASSS